MGKTRVLAAVGVAGTTTMVRTPPSSAG